MDLGRLTLPQTTALFSRRTTVDRLLRYNHHYRLEHILTQLSYRRIAIYGGGHYGMMLYEELIGTDIDVVCIIDQDPRLLFPYPVRICPPDDVLPNLCVDAIIVTPTTVKHEIIAKYRAIAPCPMLSLDSLIVFPEEVDSMIEACEYAQRIGFNLVFLQTALSSHYIKNASVYEQSLFHYTFHLAKYLRETMGVMNFEEIFQALMRSPHNFEDAFSPVCSLNAKMLFETTAGFLLQYMNSDLALCDARSKHYNVIDGRRVTTNAPEQFDNRIAFFGNCVITGIGLADQYTIPSILQQLLNEQALACRVENYAHGGFNNALHFSKLLKTPFAKGDFAVVATRHTQSLLYYLPEKYRERIVHLRLLDALQRPHRFKETFIDEYHLGANGAQLCAEYLSRYFSKQVKASGSPPNSAIE